MALATPSTPALKPIIQASSLPGSGRPFQPPCDSSPVYLVYLIFYMSRTRLVISPSPCPSLFPRTVALCGCLLCVVMHIRCILVCPSGVLLNGTSSLTSTPSGTRLHHQPPEEGDAECFWKGKQEKRAHQQVARNLHSAAARIPDFCRGLPGGQGNAGTGCLKQCHGQGQRHCHFVQLVTGYTWFMV